VRSIFAERGDEIAVVVVEPIAANMGVVPPGTASSKGLRELCDEHAALLFFDEVITGFRVAYGGAGSLYGVTPDLVSLGKIMGGGFPCAAFGGRQRRDGAAGADRPRLPGGHARAGTPSRRRRDRGVGPGREGAAVRGARAVSSSLADGLAERFRGPPASHP
jgi:glutamate-1-semialdehyde aminotransferase